MRTFRNLTAVLAALVLGLGLVTVTSTTAGAALPERTVTLKKGNQLSWNTVRVKGRVQDWADRPVVVQRKKCGKCRWKAYRKVRTNDNSRYRAKVQIPERGKWRYRTKVRKTKTYKVSFSNTISATFN